MPRVPANVMSDAEGPTVGRRRLVLVTQQDVAPTVMDAPSPVSRDLHAESNVESIPVDSESDTASLLGNAILDQDAFTLVVELLGSVAFQCRDSCSHEFL